MSVVILSVVGCNEVKLVGMMDGYVVIVYLIVSTIYKRGNKIHTTGRGSRCVLSPIFSISFPSCLLNVAALLHHCRKCQVCNWCQEYNVPSLVFVVKLVCLLAEGWKVEGRREDTDAEVIIAGEFRVVQHDGENGKHGHLLSFLYL